MVVPDFPGEFVDQRFGHIDNERCMRQRASIDQAALATARGADYLLRGLPLPPSPRSSFGMPNWPESWRTFSRSIEPTMLTTVSSVGSAATMANPMTVSP